MRILFALIFASLGLASTAGCGSNSTETSTAENTLSGKVTFQGKPVEFMLLVAIGADGKEVTAPGRTDGSYQMTNPPTGVLKFRFADAPTMPADMAPEMKPKGPKPTGPIAKYSKLPNSLRFEYTSGRMTYNIDLAE